MGDRDYTINGLARRYPSGAQYKLKEVPHKPYLEGIHGRLTGEVAFIIKCIRKHNKGATPLGFFAMARVIMPIVEATAVSEGIEPQQLLKDLGIIYPYLTWNLYRDGFAHNDEFIVAAVGTQAVQSGIVLPDTKEQADIIARDGRMLDPYLIHKNLKSYLEKRIKEVTDDEMVQVVEAIDYAPTSSNPEIKQAIAEIKDIHGRAGL